MRGLQLVFDVDQLALELSLGHKVNVQIRHLRIQICVAWLKRFFEAFIHAQPKHAEICELGGAETYSSDKRFCPQEDDREHSKSFGG